MKVATFIGIFLLVCTLYLYVWFDVLYVNVADVSVEEPPELPKHFVKVPGLEVLVDPGNGAGQLVQHPHVHEAGPEVRRQGGQGLTGRSSL